MKTIAQSLAFVFVLDLFIVAMTMFQIASGVPTPHIPFWDSQIRLVVNLIK